MGRGATWAMGSSGRICRLMLAVPAAELKRKALAPSRAVGDTARSKAMLPALRLTREMPSSGSSAVSAAVASCVPLSVMRVLLPRRSEAGVMPVAVGGCAVPSVRTARILPAASYWYSVSLLAASITRIKRPRPSYS